MEAFDGKENGKEKLSYEMYKIMQNNNNMYSPLNTYEFPYHISGAIQCHAKGESE